jgi:Spy/CpxP family protein refolding chaperone
MKKLVIMAVLATTAVTAMAQRGERPDVNPEERAQKMTEHMKKELGLSEDQYHKVLALNETRSEKMAAHREVMDAEREKMKAEQKEFRTELESILTPEQKATLEAKREEQKARMKDRSTHRREHFRGPRRN